MEKTQEELELEGGLQIKIKFLKIQHTKKIM